MAWQPDQLPTARRRSRAISIPSPVLKRVPREPILTPVASGLSIMLIPAVGLFSSMAILGEQASWVDYAALGAVLVALGSVMLPSGWRWGRAA